MTKIKIVLACLGLLGTTAFAANYNCSYSTGDQSYLLEIINDIGTRGEVAILMLNKDKKSFAFSASEISTVNEGSGVSLVKAQLGDSNLVLQYDWGDNPNAATFKVQVMGKIPSIDFPPKPSLSSLGISQTFGCSYF